MTSDPTRSARRRGGVVALITAGLYGLLGLLQWRNLIVPSWDLGIFTQLARAYGELHAPIVDIKGVGFNLLGDHFHPLLVLLAPVWWLWPSGLALLTVQAALFGLSAYPITRAACTRLGPRLGVAAGLAYALSWGLQSAAASQFHEIAFAVPLLAFALVALVDDDVVRAAAWAAPLVFVKEDLGLTVALLGALLVWRQPRRWRIGAGLAAWGVAWTVLATTVILPALNPDGGYDYSDNLGSLWEVFVPGEKWVTVLMLVAVAGVVGLRSPLMLLMLPTLAWRFTGTVEYYWGWHWHYSAVLMPIAAAALLDGLGAWRWGGAQASGGHARHVRDAAIQTSRSATRWTARAAVAAAAAVTLVLGTQLPLAYVARPTSYTQTWRMEYAQQVMSLIPQDASVATDITLMAYLVPRADVRWLNTTDPAPDYVLLDQYSGIWGDTPVPSPEEWAAQTWGGTWHLIYDEGGFALAQRVTGS